MTSADTSIRFELFRRGRFKAELEWLVANNQLCNHPFIVAELACGLFSTANNPNDLNALFALPTISAADVRRTIEFRGLSQQELASSTHS